MRIARDGKDAASCAWAPPPMEGMAAAPMDVRKDRRRNVNISPSVCCTTDDHRKIILLKSGSCPSSLSPARVPARYQKPVEPSTIVSYLLFGMGSVHSFCGLVAQQSTTGTAGERPSTPSKERRIMIDARRTDAVADG